MSGVSTVQIDREEAEAAGEAVRLLYICDFPPSNLAGGSILMSRLLLDYPPHRIAVLTSSRYLRVSPQEGRLGCEHIPFPTTKGWGRWGLGRIRNVIDWLMVPVLALFCAWIIRRRRIQLMVSVVHDRFFIAAAIVSWLTSVPLVLAVHDDWIHTQQRRVPSLKPFFPVLFRFAVRKAAHIYSVSVGMQELVRDTCGRESELQLPAIAPYAAEEMTDVAPPGLVKTPVSILYAGGIVENAETLVRLIQKGSLERYGVPTCCLDLYVPLTKEQFSEMGWSHDLINLRGWVSNIELRRALCRADILFLPASFAKEEAAVVIAGFPTKTADYMASGRPILVFGPEYSSLVRYARQCEFAEVVTESSGDALAKGIGDMVSSPMRRAELVSRAFSVLSANHDIFKQRQEFRRLAAELAIAQG
ncbi:MAG: glycosyltransferase [Candidatus Sulfotelmatobacter sp.]